jgi:hypothetical protein
MTEPFQLKKIEKDNFELKSYTNRYSDTIYVYVSIEDKKTTIAQPIHKPEDVFLLEYKSSKKLILFSIISFIKLYGRIIVKILSYDCNNDIKHIFYCYTSISDGSFWRYCIKHNSKEVYDKGYNYTSSTFINIHLQKFINILLKKYDLKKDIIKIPCLEKSIITDETLKKRIFTKTNVYYNPVFKIMNKFFPVEKFHVVNNQNVAVKKALPKEQTVSGGGGGGWARRFFLVFLLQVAGAVL